MKSVLNVILLIGALCSVGVLIAEELADQWIWSGGAIPVPSIAVPLVAVTVLAVLLAIDWFVGRFAYQPRPCPATRYSRQSNDGLSTREAA